MSIQAPGTKTIWDPISLEYVSVLLIPDSFIVSRLRLTSR
jgi:hypothetical protein